MGFPAGRLKAKDEGDPLAAMNRVWNEEVGNIQNPFDNSAERWLFKDEKVHLFVQKVDQDTYLSAFRGICPAFGNQSFGLAGVPLFQEQDGAGIATMLKAKVFSPVNNGSTYDQIRWILDHYFQFKT